MVEASSLTGNAPAQSRLRIKKLQNGLSIPHCSDSSIKEEMGRKFLNSSMWSVHGCVYYSIIGLLVLLSCVTGFEAQFRARHRLDSPDHQQNPGFHSIIHRHQFSNRKTLTPPDEPVDQRALTTTLGNEVQHSWKAFEVGSKQQSEVKSRSDHDSCKGRRIYVYDLPPDFNSNLVANCKAGIGSWLNFCLHASNEGLGALDLNGTSEGLANSTEDNPFGGGWYKTDPYMLEVIFHSRMRTYECRTKDSDEADAVFIPYYTGLDALGYLYNSTGLIEKSWTDMHGEKLVAWLREHAAKEWGRFGGKDHFMVFGRTSWDFGALMSDGIESWGTGILTLPQMLNITGLFLEGKRWMDNEQAVPYPTSFHPSQSELQTWLAKVRSAKRTSLFAFAGAPRANIKDSIRDKLLQQCSASAVCKLVNCKELKCSHNPKLFMNSFLHSNFCLQPRGDTPTRRSTFDGMIAGCIPVLFHEDSAYTQYTWHLPDEPESYSVYISEEQMNTGSSIESELRKYSEEKISQMRETIILMIPRLLYGRQSESLGFERVEGDAFDATIQGELEKVAKYKASLQSL